jgi:hypothetical protein
MPTTIFCGLVLFVQMRKRVSDDVVHLFVCSQRDLAEWRRADGGAHFPVSNHEVRITSLELPGPTQPTFNGNQSQTAAYGVKAESRGRVSGRSMALSATSAVGAQRP